MQTAGGGKHQPIRYIILHWAMDLAERHAALRTAGGLLHCFFWDVIAIDLAPVLATFARLAFVRPFGPNVNEFKHAASACS